MTRARARCAGFNCDDMLIAKHDKAEDEALEWARAHANDRGSDHVVIVEVQTEAGERRDHRVVAHGSTASPAYRERKRRKSK